MAATNVCGINRLFHFLCRIPESKEAYVSTAEDLLMSAAEAMDYLRVNSFSASQTGQQNVRARAVRDLEYGHVCHQITGESVSGVQKSAELRYARPLWHALSLFLRL